MALARTYKKTSQLVDRLTQIQFEVTRRNGTETPFRNQYSINSAGLKFIPAAEFAERFNGKDHRGDDD